MTALHPALKPCSPRRSSPGPTACQPSSVWHRPHSVSRLLCRYWEDGEGKERMERKWAVRARGSACLRWSMSREWTGCPVIPVPDGWSGDVLGEL